MKKNCFSMLFFCFVCFLPGSLLHAQRVLPDIKVKNLQGEIIHTKSWLADSLPVVVSFWSTTCKPCLTELDAFADNYDRVQEETPFKLVAVATDDRRTSSKVNALAKGRRWPFEVYLDENQDFKRAMNVNVLPQLYILDKQGNVVYTHTGYIPLSEEAVFDKLRELQHK